MYVCIYLYTYIYMHITCMHTNVRRAISVAKTHRTFNLCRSFSAKELDN